MISYFGLIRHAETFWNRSGKIQGQLDSPLTENGILSARLWGKSLKRYVWDSILASDLERAALTANLVNEELKVPVKLFTGLREQHWGRWSGKTLDEIYRADKSYIEARDFENNWNYSPPEGETRQKVIDRSLAVLRSNIPAKPKANTLVVTHAGVIRFIFLKLLNKNFAPEHIDYLRSNCIHWVIYENNGFIAGNVNEPLQIPDKNNSF